MKILALDSSGNTASVAIIEDDILKAEYSVNHKKTHSQTLMGMLDEVVRMTEEDLSSFDALAIAKGPGSFTGLRIGSASVKGLAMAISKPIVSVPTLDALAMNMWGTDRLVCPMMDARRNQVYTGLYRFSEDGKLEAQLEQCALAFSEIVEKINELGERAVILGDGVPVNAGGLADIKVPYIVAPSSMNRQRAASVGLLGSIYFSEGKYENASQHQPEYLRLSQAERERAEKEQA